MARFVSEEQLVEQDLADHVLVEQSQPWQSSSSARRPRSITRSTRRRVAVSGPPKAEAPASDRRPRDEQQPVAAAARREGVKQDWQRLQEGGDGLTSGCTRSWMMWISRCTRIDH
ncbi:MAG: hypothetical protein M5U07_16795 [Xanthobacteraceae bacterium]|nr:hypothetical protein [Xanthobacteraceae bacterium]